MKHIQLFEDFIAEKLSIQDRADAINAFGRLVKSKDIASVADTFSSAIMDDSELVNDYRIILNKYKMFDKVMSYLNDDELDPAGGRGLRSHESIASECFHTPDGTPIGVDKNHETYTNF